MKRFRLIPRSRKRERPLARYSRNSSLLAFRLRAGEAFVEALQENGVGSKLP